MWSDVRDAWCDSWCCDDGGACEVLCQFACVVSLCICAVPNCVPHDELLVRLLDVCLREDEDVDSVLLHDLDDGVNLARLHDACGVPGANS